MVVFFLLHIVLRAVYFFDTNRRNFDITTKDLVQGLPNMSFIQIFEMEHLSLTIVATIAWFRMLNYLMLSSRIWFTLKVLKNAFKKCLYYLVLFSVVLNGYALCGFTVFGSRVKEFHTFAYSFETVLIMAFGSFNNAILAKYPLIGSCFMFSFYLVVVFLMRTLFTAIVM